MRQPLVTWLGRSMALLPWLAIPAVGSQAPEKVDFAKEVAPLLKSKCTSCHGQEKSSAGLRLDTVTGLRKGGIGGPLFRPGKGAESLLVQRLRGHGGKPRMPIGFAPLTEAQIQTVIDWIDQGAVIGSEKPCHWAYVPPQRPALPAIKGGSWARNPIDRFVLARLERESLKPSPEAPKEVLARRVALDLTGLPPSVEELDEFLGDRRPDAYERYVDRLLASPHYGEKMARTWLDLARYADTNGYEKDLPRSMWPWRDWVIRAFNSNMPYDRFTVEQLAGDLLPNATKDQLIATGFHRNSMLNDEGGIDPEEFRVVAVVDRVDATATTWLGSTLACAQCHDHKYDPFSHKDYYRFFAFFNQSEDNGRDPTPLLRLPNPDQQSVLDSIEKRITDSEAELKRVPPVDFATWENLEKSAWTTPTPHASASQAVLRVLGDGSILASGPEAPNETYTVSLSPTQTVAAVRLQVVPHESLPQGGTGRNENGSFVLGQVKVLLRRADGSMTPLRLADAVADFSQPGHEPTNLLEGTGNGWAVAAFQPEHRVVHTAVFALAKPIVLAPGDRIEVTLRHHPRFPNHNIGLFRLALTDSVDLAHRTPPSAAVYGVLAKQKRTEGERKKLEEYVRKSSPSSRVLRLRIESLRRQQNGLLARAPSVMVMRDLAKPRPNRLLKRGDFRSPGDPVLAGVPETLGGKAGRGDRLGLARWLVDAKNPLTARVQANRLWEQCFGRGLVATPEDFGTQGNPPSHPELLDWLATEMVAKGWDLKAMLKLIVTSATYRQSSKVSPALLKRDPYNVLLARSSRFRVEAEGVRDIALAASGRLSRKRGGPSVMPPQPPGIWENSFSFYDTAERWVDAAGPNRYRRGLYTYWRRTAPFPMSLTFDLKSRDTCVATRSRTNTPLQALNTLNDPVFVECAGKLGETMQKRGLEYGFRSCTGRRAKPAEIRTLSRLLSEAKQRYSQDPVRARQLLSAAKVPTSDPSLAAWVVVANTILNLDETITRS